MAARDNLVCGSNEHGQPRSVHAGGTGDRACFEFQAECYRSCHCHRCADLIFCVLMRLKLTFLSLSLAADMFIVSTAAVAIALVVSCIAVTTSEQRGVHSSAAAVGGFEGKLFCDR